jgi:hypothetical protein
LEEAGPVAAGPAPPNFKEPMAKVAAPIVVNMYVPGPVIIWFPPINAELKDKEFRITLPGTCSDRDKKYFQFFTDDKGKIPLNAEVADMLRKKFTFKDCAFSVDLEDLKDVNVRSVRFNKTE